MIIFSIIKGNFEDYRRRFIRESISIAYYSMGLIKLEYIVRDPINGFHRVHFMFMQNPQFITSDVNLKDIEVYNAIISNINVHKKVNNIRNYNLDYLNKRQIILISSFVIKDIPKGIKSYLLSTDLFEVGWNLTEKYIYDQFVEYIQQNLQYLQKKYGQTN